MSLKYTVVRNITSPYHDINYRRFNQLHRIGGPASIFKCGDIFWFQYGVYHRDNGQSRVWRDGRLTYHYRGKKYTKEEYESKIRSTM